MNDNTDELFGRLETALLDVADLEFAIESRKGPAANEQEAAERRQLQRRLSLAVRARNGAAARYFRAFIDERKQEKGAL